MRSTLSGQGGSSSSTAYGPAFTLKKPALEATSAVSEHAAASLARENTELRARAQKVTLELAFATQSVADHKLGGAGVPTASSSVTEEESMSAAVPLPPRAKHTALMAPLVRAFEERIRELEFRVRRTYGMAEQVYELANENDALRDEISDAVAKVEKLRGSGSISLESTGCAEDKERVEEEKKEVEALYKLSIEQNGVLAQQNVLLKSQVEYWCANRIL